MIALIVVVVVLAATAALVLRIAVRRSDPPARSPLSYEEERENRNVAYAKQQYVDGTITLKELEEALPDLLETEPRQKGAGRPAVLSSPRPVKPAHPTYSHYHAPVVLVDGLGRVVASYPAAPPPRDPGKPTRQ